MQRNKRQRVDAVDIPSNGPESQLPATNIHDDQFINDHDAVESGGDDDEEEEGGKKSEKKAGRRKIKIEFIQDKSRRHITFSKRKAGIMKKAYELSTLTGTQVLLLVVSETGLVYTFTTAKLQPLVTQPEGKNLIQACLNAPPGSHPSSMPVGPPINRSSGPPAPMGSSAGPAAAGSGSNNLPGGLAIGSNAANSGTAPKDDDHDEEDDNARVGNKRSRRPSSAATNNTGGGGSGNANQRSPTSPPISTTLPTSQSTQQQNPSQIALSPTSPQSAHSATASQGSYGSAGSYGHGHGHDGGMYGAHGHMMPPYPPSYGSGAPATGGQPQQQLGGLAAAAAQQHHGGHWGAQPQGTQYVRR